MSPEWCVGLEEIVGIIDEYEQIRFQHVGRIRSRFGSEICYDICQGRSRFMNG